MPTFAPHVRVAFGGSLREPGSAFADEIWVCAVNAIPKDGAGFDEVSYLNAIHGPLNTWFTTAEFGMSQYASLDFIKCNRINAAGHYASSTDHFFYNYPSPSNGSAGPVDPPYVSVAISWTTALKRGPGAHGRIYPPNNTANPTGSSRIVLGAQNGAKNAGTALLTIIAGGLDPGPAPLIPCVSSGANATNTPITGVSVGDVKDVQRRRKNALRETYVHAEWS